MFKRFFNKLGSVLKTVRGFALNVITLAVVVALVSALMQSIFDRPEQPSAEGKVLMIAPKGLILDQEVFPDELEFPFNASDVEQIQTRDLVALLRRAAKDSSLAAVSIDFSETGFAGPTTALAIAQELSALRDTGKPIIAYSRALSTGSYLMASQAMHQVELSRLHGVRVSLVQMSE